MAHAYYDLLSEPLLTIDDADGNRIEASLPRALAEIGAGREIEFAFLRAHQFHAWYSSLVLIAALALQRSEQTKLSDDSDTWREVLLGLTGGRVEPWCLVVDDLAQPAFFQPPVWGGSLDVLKNAITTPDLLDVLITAKNHDVKARRITRPRPEHWAFALVTLQTMQGFLGVGNYGISRMNGGFASRPCVAAAPGLGWPRRFTRDVTIILADRERLVEVHEYKEEGGIALLWLEEWDGVKSLGSQELDPFYVEICRRVRFVEQGGAIVARRGSTKAARIAPEETKGNTGDAWTPVNLEAGTSLTVTEEGFGYRQLQNILFAGKYRLGSTGLVRKRESGEFVLVASALTRGQGKTEGFHERAIPVPPQGIQRMADPEGRATLGARSQSQVETVAEVRRRALHPAICTLLQGAPDKLDLTDDRAKAISGRLDKLVDPIFFDWLWKSLDQSGEAATSAWTTKVIELAESVLTRAIESSPLPSARRYKAIAAAERVFRGSARNNFGYERPAKEEPSDGDTTEG
jgi:CRISPR system Cascade subunit CasA